MMNEQILRNHQSSPYIDYGGGESSCNDDYGVPLSFHQGIHMNSNNNHYSLKPGILRRRSSEPAVSVRRTYSPNRNMNTRSSRKQQQQPWRSPNLLSSAVPIDQPPQPRSLYKRSISSSKLEDGLHQVRWAAATTITASIIHHPKQGQGQGQGKGGVLEYEDTLTTSSYGAASSNSSGSRNDNRQKKKKQQQQQQQQRRMSNGGGAPANGLAGFYPTTSQSGYHSAPTSRPSTPPSLMLEGEGGDGFGSTIIVRSPIQAVAADDSNKSKTQSNNSKKKIRSSSATKERKSRSREPLQEEAQQESMSSMDFQPIDSSLFGDFADQQQQQQQRPSPTPGSMQNLQMSLPILPSSGFVGPSSSKVGTSMGFDDDGDFSSEEGGGGGGGSDDHEMAVRTAQRTMKKIKSETALGTMKRNTSKRSIMGNQDDNKNKDGKKNFMWGTNSTRKSSSSSNNNRSSSRHSTTTTTRSSSNGKKRKSKRLTAVGIIPNIEDPILYDNEPSSSSNPIDMMHHSMSYLQGDIRGHLHAPLGMNTHHTAASAPTTTTTTNLATGRKKNSKLKRLSSSGVIPNIVDEDIKNNVATTTTTPLNSFSATANRQYEAEDPGNYFFRDPNTHSSPSSPVKQRKTKFGSSDVGSGLDFNTDHSPSLTAVTYVTGATATTAASSTIATTTSSSKDDLVLMAMESFRTKTEKKLDVKGRIKLVKEKSWKNPASNLKKTARRKRSNSNNKKKRQSTRMSSGASVEFNVEDQSEDGEEFFDDDDDDDDEDVEYIINFTEPQERQQQQAPAEIQWNPPDSNRTEGAMPRRKSLPGSLHNEYEPITPTFVYDRTRRRKTSSVNNNNNNNNNNTVPTFPLSLDDYHEQYPKTTSVVDAILNPVTGASMGDFSLQDAFDIRDKTPNTFSNEYVVDMDQSERMSNAFSAEFVVNMNQSDTKLIYNEEIMGVSQSTRRTKGSGGRGKKTRRRSMGHQSETTSSTRRPSMGHNSEVITSTRRPSMGHHSEIITSTRRPSMGHRSEIINTTRKGPSSRLGHSTKMDSESGVAQSRKSSQRKSKAKRRGSTSVVEMSSSSVRDDVIVKSKRREESMPPTTRRRPNNHRSKSRSKSPSKVRPVKEGMDVSSATARSSKMKNSSNRTNGKRGKRRESAPEGISSPAQRRSNRGSEKSSSVPRRRASGSPVTRRSRSPKVRLDGSNKPRQKSPKPSVSSGDKTARRPAGSKSGNRKSSKRRSSLPSGGKTLAAQAGGIEPGTEKKVRTSTLRRSTSTATATATTTDGLSQPQTTRKKKSRSKSTENRRRRESANGTKSSGSKSPKPNRRRPSMSTVALGQSSLDSHIVATPPPKQLPYSSQSSWSALTLSTAHSGENRYSVQRSKLSSQQSKTSSSGGSAEADEVHDDPMHDTKLNGLSSQ